MALIAAHLNAGVILGWHCSDTLSLFPHLRPSLISLTVSVAVKHHRRQKGLAIAADVLGGAEGWRVSLSPSVLCCSVWFAVCSVSIRFWWSAGGYKAVGMCLVGNNLYELLIILIVPVKIITHLIFLFLFSRPPTHTPLPLPVSSQYAPTPPPLEKSGALKGRIEECSRLFSLVVIVCVLMMVVDFVVCF